MKQLLFFFSIVCVSLFSVEMTAQVRFETKLSKNRLGLNERLRVSFEMNQNGDNFIPPTFDGFSVIGGPNQSVSNSWVNGVRSFSKTYTYFVTPSRKGKLTIGQASIEIEGEVYKTSPKQVEVTEAVNNPNSPQARATAIADDNLHLVAEISKSKPYLNEAVTVIYKLYFSSEISVSNVNEVEMPKYSDFWSHLIPIPKLEIKRGEYKGEVYNYVTWRKAVLYPQKAGKLTLEPLTLNVSVDVPTNRRDFFGNRVYQKTPKVITAGRRSINVRPLPEAGKPANFEGAVGAFDLTVKFNKTALKSSESFQATVKVSGRGNLKLFSLPKLSAPSSLEVYEPEHKESIKTNLLGMQGSIEDTYTIVPEYQGNYPIPPLTFSYFDPVKESYVSLNSKEALIDVFEGPVAANPSQQGNPIKQAPLINENYFDFIKLETSLIPFEREVLYRSTRFWLLLFSPYLLYFLVSFLKRRNESKVINPVTARQKHANRLAKKYLSSAKKALGEKERFYDALERALHNYLKAKLSIETSEFSKERIVSLLKEKNSQTSSISAFVSILEKCEAARYAPSSNVTMQEDFDLAVETIAVLDREI
ncbi:BatD family protein [Flavobacteriaceae bacterium]|nr:BatD family protein [Flavobacteriaceae bacterium]MDB4186130.1 BatD family protein [Flavobacteriaceae bacterium]MDC1434080.1 BatD family protein [Flavobacteriaceae bacterium]